MKIDAHRSPLRRLPPPLRKLGLAGRAALRPGNLTPVRFSTRGSGGAEDPILMPEGSEQVAAHLNAAHTGW